MSPSADRLRVVFDCNVFVQAISNQEGPAGRALDLLERNLITVYVSKPVLKELRAVLKYPTVRQKLQDMTDERIDMFMQRLAFRAT